MIVKNEVDAHPEIKQTTFYDQKFFVRDFLGDTHTYSDNDTIAK